MSQLVSALGSSAHIFGIALVFTASTYRLLGLKRRDVEATRLGDNLNGLGALLIIGSGLWRLLGGLEKPLPFYTDNPVFWTKIGLLGISACLEAYPQTVLIPWHIKASRSQVIEPLPHQFPVMFWLAAGQFPCMIGIVVCATLMVRGIGLPAPDNAATAGDPPAVVASGDGGAATSTAEGAAVYQQYCVACHQADGRGRNGTIAADFLGSGSPLAKSDEVLLASIANGETGTIGTMPPWGRVLSEDQQRAVLGYIRATYGASPIVPP